MQKFKEINDSDFESLKGRQRSNDAVVDKLLGFLTENKAELKSGGNFIIEAKSFAGSESFRHYDISKTLNQTLKKGPSKGKASPFYRKDLAELVSDVRFPVDSKIDNYLVKYCVVKMK